MTADPLGDDLAEFLSTDLRIKGTPLPGQFGPPQDADQANRMLRKLRSLERQRRELDDRRDAEVRAVEAWHDDRVAGLDREAAELERNLEGWMRGQHDQRGTTTAHLPAGELWLRQARRSIVVDDDERLALWLRGRPDVEAPIVRPRHAIDKPTLGEVVGPGGKVDGDAGPLHEFREARLNDGTVVPGVLIREPVGKAFTIHASKEHDDVNEG